MKSLLVLAGAVLLVGGCGGDAKKVCNQAYDKYVTCVEKVVGKELADVARQKKDIDACVKDKRTVKMYKHCLPVKDCEKFMTCLSDYARKHGP